ncbi:hypothetical protein [Brevibacterium atlanticum]|uniref:hypothetical protein n=1 Tax=Brevibacterium atlanticum TaxID=2697563 RepID=UPI001422DFB1|nr:hypothetical protein [Brevibacterium atlanticum]
MINGLAPGRTFAIDRGNVDASLLLAAHSIAQDVEAQIGGPARLVSASVEPQTASAALHPDSDRTVITAVDFPGAASARVEVTSHDAEIPGAESTVRLVFDVDIAVLDEQLESAALHCPGNRQWNSALETRLKNDAEFSRLIENYDGTIGLQVGSRPVHIRCYRGTVLEVASRSLLGSDFTVTIPGDVFIWLMTTPRNAFMEAAMRGTLKTDGSGYEYLRMTSALVRVIDLCRVQAAASGWIGTPTSDAHHESIGVS